jgi:glutamyl-tRNA synthetase
MTDLSTPDLPVRTRFAPSPTGFLHVGGARTALFAWAFARHFGGTFVLRIEDTDVARSTPEAVQAILDGMAWLGLSPDEGPFYQMQRMSRYREVLAQMLAAGTAYECWATPAELDAMREAQRQRGEKPRYDGRWRPENRQRWGLVPPEGLRPVLRFRNPDEGVVSWNDWVKGPIAIANAELDDLVIARADGTPTYNFCVVVDDWDMRITHVFRGDDHVNNTPRQINILRALGAPLPFYGHLPMIHGPDGQKLSKRHGAVSVMQFDEEGYLPEAMVNYLARLGWSHNDDELFDRAQFVGWFDGTHLAHAPAQFDFAKLRWMNQHYLKQKPDSILLGSVKARLEQRGLDVSRTDVQSVTAAIGLFKERAATLEELADWMAMLWFEPTMADAVWHEKLAAHHTPVVLKALVDLREQLAECAWDAAGIAVAMKACLTLHGLKMPELAVPVRLKVFGRAQTPSVDAMLALLPRERVLARLAA